MQLSAQLGFGTAPLQLFAVAWAGRPGELGQGGHIAMGGRLTTFAGRRWWLLRTLCLTRAESGPEPVGLHKHIIVFPSGFIDLTDFVG